MTTSDEWLKLLEDELARRTERIEWEAAEPERARQQFMAELEAIAERFVGAVGSGYVPRFDELSTAELMALHLVPNEFLPAGLPTIEQIWGEYQTRKNRYP